MTEEIHLRFNFEGAVGIILAADHAHAIDGESYRLPLGFHLDENVGDARIGRLTECQMGFEWTRTGDEVAGQGLLDEALEFNDICREFRPKMKGAFAALLWEIMQ